MAIELGWRRNDIDLDWGEPPALVAMHAQCLEGRISRDVLRVRILEYLAGLERPWIVKDPRIGLLWDIWRPILEPRPVAVILSQRRWPDVLSSYRKRGWNTDAAKQSRDAAESAFESWPGAKCRLQYESLCCAAALVDR